MKSREFELVSCLCRWPPSAARDDACRAAAAAPLDWDRWLRMAQRHRVEGLVHSAMRAAAIAPPPHVEAALGAKAARVARVNLEQARESVRIASALRSRGVDPIFLKGTTLALLAYKRIDIKSSLDIDVYVPSGQIEISLNFLAEIGYKITTPNVKHPSQVVYFIDVIKHCTLQHSEKNIIVEVHWRLFDTPKLLPCLASRNRLQPVTVGPVALWTFDDLGLFTYLCGHGARHGWARLKWLADLHALLGQRDAAEVEGLYHAAVAIGAGRTPAVALLLCADIFGLPLRGPFMDHLRSDRPVRWLLSIAMRMMTANGEGGSEHRALAALSVEASQFIFGLGRHHVIDVLRMKWRGTQERLAFPLPKPLHFLYNFLRPPLWIARRARSIVTINLMRRIFRHGVDRHRP